MRIDFKHIIAPFGDIRQLEVMDGHVIEFRQVVH